MDMDVSICVRTFHANCRRGTVLEEAEGVFVEDDPTTRGRLQGLIDRSPFSTWLGMRVTAAGSEGLEIAVDWRHDFVSAPERLAMHGGVVAGLLDATAVFAVLARIEGLAATVDLRIDFHGIPAPEPMRLLGRVVRLGRSISTSDASLFDARGKLAASGRATVMALNA